MFKLKTVLFIMIAFLILATVPVEAQDPTEVPLSAEQQELLARLDAADLDQRTWQSYQMLTFSNTFYSENLLIAPGNSVLFQQNIASNITSQFDGNPLNPIYNQSDLMLVDFTETSVYSGSDPIEDSYTLLADVMLIDSRLFVRAFRSDESEFLPEMPPEGWLEVTEAPDQYPALSVINLSQYLPDTSSSSTGLLTIDFVSVVRQAALRDLIADIELVGQERLQGQERNAGRLADHIRVRLNPVAVLEEAFADVDTAQSFIDTFVNESIEMTVSIWLDPVSSRRLREEYIILLQGSPSPDSFGYTEGDITADSTLEVQLLREISLDYFAINELVELEAPLE